MDGMSCLFCPADTGVSPGAAVDGAPLYHCCGGAELSFFASAARSAHYDESVEVLGVVTMTQVGARRVPAVAMRASGLLLAQGAGFSGALERLSPSTFTT